MEDDGRKGAGMLSEVHEGLRLGFYGSLKAGMNQAVILCKGITFTEPQLRITTTNVRCIMLESILVRSCIHNIISVSVLHGLS